MGLLDKFKKQRQQRELELKERQAELVIRQERAANGHCPKCNSDKLQAVTNTTSKQAFGSGSNIADLAYGVKNKPTHTKVQTTIVRVCLNCGCQFR